MPNYRGCQQEETMGKVIPRSNCKYINSNADGQMAEEKIELN